MDHPAIEGRRVRLRPTTPGDLPVLRTLFGDPEIYEFWGGYARSDEEIATEFLGDQASGVQCFLVEADGRVIGYVQYYRATTGDEGGGMDMVLRRAERGKGYGSDVAEALVRFIRNELGWRRFIVDPDVSNRRAVGFWKKVGFRPVRMVDDEPGREPFWLMEWPFGGPRPN